MDPGGDGTISGDPIYLEPWHPNILQEHYYLFNTMHAVNMLGAEVGILKTVLN